MGNLTCQHADGSLAVPSPCNHANLASHALPVCPPRTNGPGVSASIGIEDVANLKLHHACEHGDMHSIIEALAAGADIEGGPPPKARRSRSRDNSREQAVSLMDDGTDGGFVGCNLSGLQDLTPLMQASKAGKAMAVALLLDTKASPHATNRTGMQALHYAASVGCCDCCRYLIAAGACPVARDCKERDAFACLPNYCVEVEYREWAEILGLDTMPSSVDLGEDFSSPAVHKENSENAGPAVHKEIQQL